jgi:hypothetical protein
MAPSPARDARPEVLFETPSWTTPIIGLGEAAGSQAEIQPAFPEEE